MERIGVKANFDSEGNVTPLTFTYQGKEIPVESTGRQWQAADGLHILVMARQAQVYQLLFVGQEAAWYLLPRTGPAAPGLA